MHMSPPPDPPPLSHSQVAIKNKSLPAGHVVSRTNFKYLYWNVKQQLVHHTVTGCNMQPGDLLGSGTISGPDPGMFGSMLELCWKGTKPMDMPDGSTRKFLADGDSVVMTGACTGEGYSIGFGAVEGEVTPAAGAPAS